MHRLAWILQVVLGIYFIAVGVLHFVVPDGLPEQMAWMYELSTTLHMISGTAEILGGLGLILPAWTRVRPALTPLAAVGLTVVMVLAAVWHLQRGETQNLASNLVLALLLLGVASVRWRTHRIESR